MGFLGRLCVIDTVPRKLTDIQALTTSSFSSLILLRLREKTKTY
jgi:hypothetical protein